MNSKFITTSADDTQKKASQFSQTLQGGEIISLIGDLGGGKTTFTQGLAKGLKIFETVASPTFVIMKKYKINKNNLNYLYHFDLYRINSSQDLTELGFDEIINDPKSVIVIEWAEKAESLIPKTKNIKINFKYRNKDKREIEIVK